MRFSRARYVTLCQQSLVTAAVLAVGVSAAGVKTLDIVPQPGATAGAARRGRRRPDGAARVSPPSSWPSSPVRRAGPRQAGMGRAIAPGPPPRRAAEGEAGLARPAQRPTAAPRLQGRDGGRGGRQIAEGGCNRAFPGASRR